MLKKLVASLDVEATGEVWIMLLYNLDLSSSGAFGKFVGYPIVLGYYHVSNLDFKIQSGINNQKKSRFFNH